MHREKFSFALCYTRDSELLRSVHFNAGSAEQQSSWLSELRKSCINAKEDRTAALLRNNRRNSSAADLRAQSGSHAQAASARSKSIIQVQSIRGLEDLLDHQEGLSAFANFLESELR
jgi:hypothetical protein